MNEQKEMKDDFLSTQLKVKGKYGIDSASSFVASGTKYSKLTSDKLSGYGLTDSAILQTFANNTACQGVMHGRTPVKVIYDEKIYAEMGAVPPYIKIQAGSTPPAVTVSEQKQEQLAAHFFTNKTDFPGTFVARLGVSHGTEVTSSWSIGGSITYGEELEVDAAPFGVGATVHTSIQFTLEANYGQSNATTTEVSSEDEIWIELTKGQEAVAELSAYKSSVQVLVEYGVKLRGDILVKYNKAKNDTIYQSLPIETILQAQNPPLDSSYTTTLTMGFSGVSDGFAQIINPTKQSQ